MHKMSDVISRMWTSMRIKENFMRQKVRLKWDINGDSTSKFFHSVAKDRRRKFFIGNLLTDKGLVREVGEVKEEVWKHFGKKFVENDGNRPILEEVIFCRLTQN